MNCPYNPACINYLHVCNVSSGDYDMPMNLSVDIILFICVLIFYEFLVLLGILSYLLLFYLPVY